MGKPNYKYRVVLRDGSEYLTETYAEAKALEATDARVYQRSRVEAPVANPARGRLARSALVPNSSAPMSRKERMKPALNDGYKHPPQAWVREIIQNSFDNDATSVEFAFGNNDAQAIDNGSGMGRDLLLNKFLVPGMSGSRAGSVGGFGEAKKLLTFPWDHFAIVTLQAGGKVEAAIGVGGRWDYWQEDKCYDVEYDDSDEPQATKITPTQPNAKYLPHAELSSIVAQLKAQGHGTALYIRGTTDLTAYLASLKLDKVLGGNKGLPSVPDATSYVVLCELPGKLITINGIKFRPDVKIPESAKKMPAARSYGGVELWWVEPESGCSPAVIVVRAKNKNGTQVMWTEGGVTAGTLFVQITGDTKRLLNNTRDSFEYFANDWWSKFKTQFAKDVSSMFREDSFDEEYTSDVDPYQAHQHQMREDSDARDRAQEARQKFEENYKPDQDELDREEKKQAAQDVAAEIEQATAVQPARGAPAEQTQTPKENVENMCQDAVEGDAADVAGIVRLALWRPPLRIINEFINWTPHADYLPETMGVKQIRLLRAWTEAIRRILAILYRYDHKFVVGFIFSEKIGAANTSSKTIPGAEAYVINPFVSSSELRKEKLFIPPSRVSLVPTSKNAIPLDVYDDQHLAILVARACHEIVHGVYGVVGHDEDFSSALTALLAQIGDKYKLILRAAEIGARMPVPKQTKRRGGDVETENKRGYKPPEKKEGGRDPRLPSMGTVLERDGLTVIVGTEYDGRVYVLESPHAERGMHPSLSSAVKRHLQLATYNGFQYFKLNDYPKKKSPYEVDKLTDEGVRNVRETLKYPAFSRKWQDFEAY